MAGLSMTAQDKVWQAERDARSLAEAELIKGDVRRMRAAKVQAKKMAIEKAKEAAKLKKVATTKTAPKKRTVTKRKRK